MGGHRWRVRAGFAARWAGLAAGRHREVRVGVVVGGDLDPIDQLAKQLLDGIGVAVLDGPANNFSIRHFNDRQKADYESPTWISWMFYVNLSTIHLITRLLRRQANRGSPEVGLPAQGSPPKR